MFAGLVFMLTVGGALAQDSLTPKDPAAPSGTATCPAPAAGTSTGGANGQPWSRTAEAGEGGPGDMRPEFLARSEVKDRMKEILAGPDFSPEEVTRVPAFKNKNRQPDKKPEWMKGLENFFRGLAEVMRIVVWVVVAIGVVALLVGLHYWWRMAAARTPGGVIDLPTQVAGLDIRRESLPDDIAAAARAAWQRGDTIHALSLLYRGALSALVLRHGVAIRSSFTEQECLRAVRRSSGVTGGLAGCISRGMVDYFARLTEAWLHAVYARRMPADEVGLNLCAEFDRHVVPVAGPAGSGVLAGEGA